MTSGNPKDVERVVQASALSWVTAAQTGMAPEVFATKLIAPLKAARSSLKGLIILPLVIIGVLILGASQVNSGPMCGGKRMRPGDRCVSYKTGSSSSYSDVSNAPIQHWWFWLIIVAVLALIWLWLLRGRLHVPAEAKTRLRARYLITMAGLDQAMNEHRGNLAMVQTLQSFRTSFDAAARKLAGRMQVDLDAGDHAAT